MRSKKINKNLSKKSSENECPFTDGELRRMFRYAKYKNKQIKIMSQLTNKPIKEICKIVGYKMPSKRKTQKEIVEKCLKKGMSIENISKKFHLKRTQIYPIKYRMEKKHD